MISCRHKNEYQHNPLLRQPRPSRARRVRKCHEVRPDRHSRLRGQKGDGRDHLRRRTPLALHRGASDARKIQGRRNVLRAGLLRGQSEEKEPPRRPLRLGHAARDAVERTRDRESLGTGPINVRTSIRFPHFLAPYAATAFGFPDFADSPDSNRFANLQPCVAKPISPTARATTRFAGKRWPSPNDVFITNAALPNTFPAPICTTLRISHASGTAPSAPSAPLGTGPAEPPTSLIFRS